ncbi:hypothetical protein EYZ11_007280 [Aspergillus tanneri]|uniref:Uncharacterized protein n=1 Tax=Aspergillus tanneri TaxID=1220188 RepID=A0A4S3JDB4_9EURO|nr:hypothetical protein EYZ11_007280 [Aspergillus tanneri]
MNTSTGFVANFPSIGIDLQSVSEKATHG